MKTSLAILLLLLIGGCKEPHTTKETHTLDFGAFTIEVPISWSKLEAQGADSYVGRIAIDNHDTLDFDLGWYSNKLNDDPIIMDSNVFVEDAYTGDATLIPNPNKIDLDKYRKNNLTWDTIDGRNAKIVFPIRSGIGTTGIYIDSLWQAGSDVDRFNLYGVDLKPENEKLVLKTLKTLRFHKGK